MAYPAILLAMFPLATVALVQFLAGILFCFCSIICITNRVCHGLRAVITILMIVPFITMLFTGNFEVFFTFGMMLKALVLILPS